MEISVHFGGAIVRSSYQVMYGPKCYLIGKIMKVFNCALFLSEVFEVEDLLCTASDQRQ